MTFTDPWVMTSGMNKEVQDQAWTFTKFLVSEEQATAYSWGEEAGEESAKRPHGRTFQTVSGGGRRP